MVSTWKDKIYTILAIVFLVIIWKVIADLVGFEIILPSPEATLKRFILIVKSKTFYEAVFNTVIRSLAGFFIAFFIAGITGFLAGTFRPFYHIFNPVVVTIKAMPTISIILLALIWLKSDKAPILVGFLVIFPIIYSNIVEGIKNVDSQLIDMAKMYRVKKWRIIKELYIPSILSYIMAGASTALGLNLKVVIAAEVLSQSRTSIGESLQLEKIYLNTAGVFSWTIVAIIISGLFEYSLRFIQRKSERWK